MVALHIEHESVQDEAGHSRQVKAQIKAVAFGTTAERIRQVPLGQAVQVSGFLANAKKFKTPVLHIQEFKVMEWVPAALPSAAAPNVQPAAQSSIVHL